jgi:predicted amidohydrolase YtcJ
VKILVADHALPSLATLGGWIARAHGAGRPVAVHCVTRAALFLALAAWREAGSVPGDRMEHASVTPPEAVAELASLSITVVTQPGFIRARGDAYLREVEPVDQPDLYRCASFLRAGVAVGGSTDAPFGPDDPWVAVRAAIERRAESGAVVGSDPGLDPLAALRLFLGPPGWPGGPIRRIGPGEAADLCLLDVPLRAALADPTSGHVAATFVAGQLTFSR